jgi:hypothetical protein
VQYEAADPPCPHFGECGGCQLQHMTYASQLEWKRDIAARTLATAGVARDMVEPVVPSPKEWGYRTKLTPHYSVGGLRAASIAIFFVLFFFHACVFIFCCPVDLNRLFSVGFFFSSGDLGPVNLDGACPPIGFNRRMGLGRGRIVDVDHCLIASDPINRELKVARAKVAAVFEGWDRVRVNFF